VVATFDFGMFATLVCVVYRILSGFEVRYGEERNVDETKLIKKIYRCTDRS